MLGSEPAPRRTATAPMPTQGPDRCANATVAEMIRITVFRDPDDAPEPPIPRAAFLDEPPGALPNHTRPPQCRDSLSHVLAPSTRVAGPPLTLRPPGR